MKFGFEETTYLLLFGELPNKAQLDSFKEISCSRPAGAVRSIYP